MEVKTKTVSSSLPVEEGLQSRSRFSRLGNPHASRLLGQRSEEQISFPDVTSTSLCAAVVGELHQCFPKKKKKMSDLKTMKSLNEIAFENVYHLLLHYVSAVSTYVGRAKTVKTVRELLDEYLIGPKYRPMREKMIAKYSQNQSKQVFLIFQLTFTQRYDPEFLCK